MMDVAILVTSVTGEDPMHGKGIWVNQTLNKPLDHMHNMAGVNEVIIAKNELDKWKVCE